MSDVPRRRVLIVDDHPQIVELIEAYLEPLNLDVEVARDGREALECLARRPPDVVLLDIMMPRLSGYEVCRRIKDDPATRHIRVIMVTALNELGDVERARESGADEYISKPVNKIELLALVARLLDEPPAADRQAD